jgi:hypothetical protein
MKRKLTALLNSRTTFYGLLLLFAVSSFSTFWYGHVTGFSDEGHYWSLAKGMHHGKFSAWYFLPVSTPETLRTWGYPFFLYLCQFFSSSYMFVQVVQLLLFVITIVMCCRIIQRYYPALMYRSVFILLLVFNNHLAFYAGVLVAECVFIFFLTWFVYVYIFYRETFTKYILLALISFALYQLRPLFLLFPVALFLYMLLKKRSLKYNVTYLVLFLLSLIPFGLWNKSNHGVFKITPLEGGNGVMYQGGYWDYRLPVGFTAPYYWGITVDDDLLQPPFLSKDEQQKEAVRYVAVWESILAELKKNHYSREDSLRERYEQDTAYAPLRNFMIYGSGYTMARENILKKNLMNEIKANPGFYIKTRIYNFFRQWVTGVNGDQLRNARGIKGYAKALYPFLVTFIFIFCGLFWVTIQLLRRKLSWKKFDIFFLLIGYFAIMNLPFGVMSRYTAPVHAFILIMVAVSLVNLLFKPSDSLRRTEA